MRHKVARRLVAAVALGCLVAVAAAAHAEIPAANPPDIDGAEHAWVVERMAFAPYTELSEAEKAVLRAGKAALASPPEGLIRAADHGYATAQTQVALANSLRDTEPTIVGHELIVWNEDRAARVYVSANGPLRLLDLGDVQPMLVAHAVGAADAGDEEALESARRAFALAAGLDPAIAPAEGGLVTAHAVGFADRDGTHTIVRVDPAGNTSLPDW